jgi:hypothetical protein
MNIQIRMQALICVTTILFTANNCLGQVTAGPGVIITLPPPPTGAPPGVPCHTVVGTVSCATTFPGFTPGGIEDQCLLTPCDPNLSANCLDGAGLSKAYWKANPSAADWNNTGEIVNGQPSPPPSETAVEANRWWCMKAWLCQCKGSFVSAYKRKVPTNSATAPPYATIEIIDWSLVPAPTCIPFAGLGGGQPGGGGGPQYEN